MLIQVSTYPTPHPQHGKHLYHIKGQEKITEYYAKSNLQSWDYHLALQQYSNAMSIRDFY